MALGLGLGLGPIPGAAQDAGGCVLTRVAGAPATVVRDGTPVTAEPGLDLRQSDILRTGEAALMTVRCADGLTITVGPATTMSLELYATAGEPPRAGLVGGVAGFLFNRTDRRGFEVVTPSAVAAVRGTDWAMLVQGGATSVFVRDGAVAVADVTLTAGEGIDIAADGTAGGIETWSAERVAGLDAQLGPDWMTGSRP